MISVLVKVVTDCSLCEIIVIGGYLSMDRLLWGVILGQLWGVISGQLWGVISGQLWTFYNLRRVP